MRLVPVVLAALAGSTLAVTAGSPQNADVFARRGIYVEADGGVFELRHSVEAKPLADAAVLKAYRYIMPATLSPLAAKVVLSFVINMPGDRAEAWVAASQLLFVLGREVEEGRGNNYAQMTPKISRMRPSVYLVQSAEFEPAWLKQTYERLAGETLAQRPEAFITLIVQDVSGQPRKMYPVKVFGDRP